MKLLRNLFAPLATSSTVHTHNEGEPCFDCWEEMSLFGRLVHRLKRRPS